jgi:hypothetical protein
MEGWFDRITGKKLGKHTPVILKFKLRPVAVGHKKLKLHLGHDGFISPGNGLLDEREIEEVRVYTIFIVLVTIIFIVVQFL